jgi:hypothetical protein
MFSAAVYTVIVLALGCYLSDYLLSMRDDPAEPPRAKSPLPLIGHLLGLIKSGTLYFSQIR